MGWAHSTSFLRYFRADACLAFLPLFCLSLGYLPVPTGLPSYLFCLCWPIPGLPYTYSMATYGRCLSLFPTSFRGYCRASSLLPSALLGLALGCPVLHLLYMGLRPVTCPVHGSCASGISTHILWYLYLGVSLLAVGSYLGSVSITLPP